MLAVPLRLGDRTIGVVEVLNKRDNGGFSARDQEIVVVLAALAAVAIHNIRLHQKLADVLRP